MAPSDLPPHVSFPTGPAPRPCPACGGAARAVYGVRGIPIHSCVLLPDAEAARRFPLGDLLLAHCPACGFLFNSAFDSARIDYAEGYEETQGFSGTFMKFLEGTVRGLTTEHGVRNQHVVEIGPGRGDFLELLCRAGDNAGVGIDPSSTAGRVDRTAGRGLTFETACYGPEHATLPTDLLACRHTLEHLPDVGSVAALWRANLESHARSRVFVEVPDTLRILDEGAFWDVYYEHTSYFTAGSLARLFAANGFDVDAVSTVYGDQYLHLFATPNRGAAAATSAPDDLARITSAVDAFREACAASLARWHAVLEDARQANERVALWGSGSKATGFLTTLGLGDLVDCVVDINPDKHGQFVAGTGHEIVAPDALAARKPDRVIAMNPVYLNEIGADLERLGVDAELTAV